MSYPDPGRPNIAMRREGRWLKGWLVLITVPSSVHTTDDIVERLEHIIEQGSTQQWEPMDTDE